ncbi:MAG: hypothetical protein J0L92_41430 [Deltaproteobacteria bacterium]|nr:hypothetical protein [Deltaproteobacteria bacterium]
MPATGAEHDGGASLRALALPMIGTQVALVAMPWTDAFVMASLGEAELAGGALGASLLSSAFVLVSCLVGGLGPLTARAITRGDEAAARALARHALMLALAVTLPLGALALHAQPWLEAAGLPGPVASAAASYLLGASPTLLATPLVLVHRHLLAARRLPGVVTTATALAVPANLGLDLLLAHGVDGALPPCGVLGIGIATSVVTVWMAAGLWWWTTSGLRTAAPLGARSGGKDLEARAVRELVALGAPIVAAVALEVGVFLGSSFVVGSQGSHALAAHTVALQVTQVLFVIPNGLAQASAIHVARAHDMQRATRAALAHALAAGGLAACGLLVLRAEVADAYLAGTDREAGALAASLLGVVAAFHVADSLQVTAAGCLRGRRDTRTAMWTGVVAYGVLTPLVGGTASLFVSAPLAVWLGLGAGVAAAGAFLALRALVPRTPPASGPG